MHNVFVSKIRCDSPNNLGTRHHNKNAFIYIATRAGVDCTPLPREKVNDVAMSDNKTYLKYIKERPRSHGLFGNYEDLETKDITELGRDMYKLSKTKVVYRAIFSLDEQDAQELGYTSNEKWNEFLTSNMPDVANQLDIPIDKLRWCAAFHNEPGHPHVHCMFWNAAKEIRKPFISIPSQHAIRERLSGEIFKEERFAVVMQKNTLRNAITEAGKEIVKGDISTPHLHVKDVEFVELTKHIHQVIEKLPGKGRMNYKFMPKDAKAAINDTIDCILKNPQIGDAYNEYIKSVENISQTYSPTKKHHHVNVDRSKRDLYARMGNILLNHIKSCNQDEELCASSIDTVIDLHIEDDSQAAHEIDHLNLTANDTDISDRDVGNSLSMKESNFNGNDNDYEPESIGKGCDIDLNKAIDYYKSAAELKNDKALFSLAKLYIKNGNQEELRWAVKSLNELLARTDNKTIIQYVLGCLYTEKDNAFYNLEAGKSLLTESASQENQFAQYKLGKLYSDPDNGILDMDKAISFLRESASQENQFAQYQLGKIYANPELNVYDEEKAFQYLNEALEQGNEFAQYQLCKLYASEESIYFDMNKALLLLTQLANTESPVSQFAQCKLGNLYLWGKGTPKNEELGRCWLQKAIAQGNTFAIRTIQMYEQQQLMLAGKLFIRIFKFFGSNIDDHKLHTQYSIKTDSVKAQKDLLHKLNRKHHEHTSDNQ